MNITIAQEYVEKARQGWWKAFIYRGYAVIQQHSNSRQDKYAVYNSNGEFVSSARTQSIAKLCIEDDINEIL